MAEEGYGYGYESRFICKLCNKRYPCGKSLGGHMRSHVVAEFQDKNSTLIGDESGNVQSGYGLRENPKKTWRAVDSRVPLPQDKVCKQCGKGFQSMKALCGHMACHSEKDKSIKDDNSWTSENLKTVVDSQSDTELAEERRVMRTRSFKSKRYKKTGDDSAFGLGNNGSNSSVSEFDGQEQEEVALCLMLLSRDCGNKGGGVDSIVESSDNYSVVMETKSSSTERLKYVGNEEGIKKNEYRKLKDGVLEGGTDKTENSDSGYFLDECTKAESDVSVDWFRRYSAIGECDKSLNVIKSCRTELSKSSKENECDDDGMGSKLAEIKSRKRKYKTENHESSELCNTPQKKSKYECFNCKKSFKSYQALGGHRPCHKRAYESRDESGENSLDDSTDYRTKGKIVESSSNRKPSAKNSFYNEKKSKPKKNKGHVCPFCDRVFKNGQALGGHKRSHFITGHDQNNNPSPIVKPDLPDLLDLNLPAPEADEDNGQFFSW